MPDSVKAMVRKGPRDSRLHHPLQHPRPLGEARRHGRAAPAPPQQRRDQVPEAEDVEAAAEHAARDAVQDRRNPGDLRLVDAEVRGHGAVEALVLEDLVGFGGGCGYGFVGGDGRLLPVLSC